MALILHVGDSKCGSTAIQTSLHRARASLLDRGILYETGPKRRDHTLLGTLVGQVTRSNDPNQKKDASDVLKSIAASSGSVKHTILSSEAFLTIQPEAILGLMRRYEIDTSDVIAVAYLREPTSMYRSLVQQQLKGSYRFLEPTRYHRPLDILAGRWQRALGKSRVHVRLFARERLMGGNVVVDFANILSQATHGTPVRLPSNISNVSISSEQLMVLQQLRTRLPASCDGKLRRESNLVAASFNAMNQAGMIGNKIELNHMARKAVADRNSATIRKINAIIPDLRMPLPNIGASEDTAAVYDCAASTPVSSILAHSDTVLANTLADIVFMDGQSRPKCIKWLVTRYGEATDCREAILSGLKILDSLSLRTT